MVRDGEAELVSERVRHIQAMRAVIAESDAHVKVDGAHVQSRGRVAECQTEQDDLHGGQGKQAGDVSRRVLQPQQILAHQRPHHMPTWPGQQRPLLRDVSGCG